MSRLKTIQHEKENIKIISLRGKKRFVFFISFVYFSLARVQFRKKLDLKQTIYFMWPKIHAVWLILYCSVHLWSM